MIAAHRGSLLRIDANPIQLLREVFRPLPPTAEIDAPEGDEKDSVLDAVVISDMARILAEQKDEAETAELKENKASEADEENSIDSFDSDEETATNAALAAPETPASTAPRLSFESESDLDSENTALINTSTESEEPTQEVEEDTESVAEAETAVEEETEPQLTISLEQSA